MKTIRRIATVAVLSCALAAFAAAPVAAPPTPGPAAKPAPLTEYPLSCNAAAKPLVFKGWDAQMNSRMDEGKELLKQAVAADPKCVLARAWLSVFTPGPDGDKLLDEALTQTAGLTEIEKLDLQMRDADRHGDPEKAYALAQKTRDLGPNIFILNLRLAYHAQALNKWDEMGAAAKKATELNPKSGAGWNPLGYSNLSLHKNDDAVAAFRKYVEVAPAEPNGHDSLADALLANNQLDEATAEYQKAIDVSGGKFWGSWDGIATVKAIKGDWDGARAALRKQKDAAPEPSDKINASNQIAWAWFAQGKLAEGLKATEAEEKEAVAAKLDVWVGIAQLNRGAFYLLAGKYAEALKSYASEEKLKLDGLNDGEKKLLGGWRLVDVVEAQSRLGKMAEAEKAFAALEELYKATPADPAGIDHLAFGRGALALKKDPKAAVESFKKCTELYDYCKLALAEAQDKAGDAAGASDTRTALAKVNHRNPVYWYVHAQALAKLKTPGKKVAAEGAKK